MANLSAAQQAAFSAAWSDEIEMRRPAIAGAAVAGIDIEAEFCKDWPTAKSVLQALAGFVPQPGPVIINLVIAAGDAAQSNFCKAT